MKSAAAFAAYPAPEGRKPNGFELVPAPSGNLRLKLWGRLPPGWAGALSSGLSRKGISIVRGSARKVNTAWEAIFELDPSRSLTDPHRVDFLALATDERDSGPAPAISLASFYLGDPARNGGALILEIRAEDQLGFLGALLNRLSFLSLFPEEMEIETMNGKALDRFRIRGLGGATPSPSSHAALERKLGEMVKG